MNLIPDTTATLPEGARKVTALSITDTVLKGHDSNGRPCFYVTGTYAVDDGSTQPTRVTSEKKKDLPAKIIRKQAAALAGQITLENGFEVQRFTMG